MRRVLAIGIVVVASGCLADLTFATDADIPCVDARDCPDDFVCRERLGRCLPVDGLDETAPALVERSIDPPRAKAGDIVTISLLVSEPLLENPQIPDPFALSSVDGERFVFVAEMEKSEDDGPRLIAVDLVDMAGNEAVDLEVGTLTTDFRGPNARTLPICSAPATEVRCEVSFNEIVAVDGVQAELRAADAQLDQGIAMVIEEREDVDDGDGLQQNEADGLSNRFDAVLYRDGTEAPGQYVVAFRATDLVGNNGGFNFGGIIIVE